MKKTFRHSLDERKLINSIILSGGLFVIVIMVIISCCVTISEILFCQALKLYVSTSHKSALNILLLWNLIQNIIRNTNFHFSILYFFTSVVLLREFNKIRY